VRMSAEMRVQRYRTYSIKLLGYLRGIGFAS
jgi:hypothetical protein